jgi:tRNA A37 threonylcarbamoyladenosine synthetase subunit TsaC/SUA5/YrdC
VVADDGAIAYETPSTLVRVLGGKLEILRPGPVGEQEIRLLAGAEDSLTADQASAR